jgi:hypothetical protein
VGQRHESVEIEEVEDEDAPSQTTSSQELKPILVESDGESDQANVERPAKRARNDKTSTEAPEAPKGQKDRPKETLEEQYGECR